MKNKQIKLLVERYPVLKAIENEVFNAYQILENCYAHGGKLLVGCEFTKKKSVPWQ